MNSHTENNTDNERTDKKRWFALYTLALGLAMIVVDGTIVGVAVGAAVSGAVLSASLVTTLPDALAKAGLPTQQLQGLIDAVRLSAGSALPGVRHATPQSQMCWRKALRWRPATPCLLRPRSCSSDCWQH